MPLIWTRFQLMSKRDGARGAAADFEREEGLHVEFQ
jgi:hypothetical protein